MSSLFNIETKICEACGVEFAASRWTNRCKFVTQRYCSRSCNKKLRHVNETRICKKCGVEQSINEFSQVHSEFCRSYTCKACKRADSRAKYRRARKSTAIINYPSTRTCKKCKLELPIEKFQKSSKKDGCINRSCNPCMAIAAKARFHSVMKSQPNYRDNYDRREPVRVCSKCKTERPIRDFHWNMLVRLRACRFCDKKNVLRSTPEGWCRHIAGKKAQLHRRNRGPAFNVTIEHLLEIMPADRCCPVLGLPFEFSVGHARNRQPSIDRIDPQGGYVNGNVAIISYRANRLKSDATIEELEKLLMWLKSVSSRSVATDGNSTFFSPGLHSRENCATIGRHVDHCSAAPSLDPPIAPTAQHSPGDAE